MRNATELQRKDEGDETTEANHRRRLGAGHHLERTQRFYRDGLGLETSDIDEGIIVVELPNLSLFLMDRQAYAEYAGRGGVLDSGTPAPGACMFSARSVAGKR